MSFRTPEQSIGHRLQRSVAAKLAPYRSAEFLANIG
jgi:hypothetical protein